MTSPSVLSVLSRLSSQVCITTSPSPQNLGQCKQILAALQKYGEVYDICNTNQRPERPILAIFETQDAAERAIAASPITIPLTLSQPVPAANPFAAQHSSSSSSSSSSSVAPATPSALTCTIESSRHNHSRGLRRNPFYGSFAMDRTDPVFNDMKDKATGTPLAELRNVLQRRQRPTALAEQSAAAAGARRMGADSLMTLWREGLEEAERGYPHKRKAGEEGKSETPEIPERT
ncbi:hypothetical protein N7462_007388 [Penicillium macrosclerotiorum]|uniref:uncharacterized protein n=1 Tax=Penicillium macrosclerotiorum TaxID=303699 RepID=UPI002546623B|nr:uncharacterized protein N7462_007388 [Penicillium macrosclerotiorum]KAJ5679144.1 hypothetical protein N7462_007388 [Penicillium macrosclerotiorum]